MTFSQIWERFYQLFNIFPATLISCSESPN
nr:MAG TPA: hypothetical protein [Caudoviricetes sp.]